jgi:hypothetical protein
MIEMFKLMIEERCYDDIYSAMNNEISDNYDRYDLETRTNVVNEILSASLDHVEILRVYNVKQDSDGVTFTALVSCDIEVGDYAYGENISEDICQWFELNCSADLGGDGINNISVDTIAAYNKN